MTLHAFYRKYSEVPKDDKFQIIQMTKEVTSLFVIFKQLEQVRAQKRMCEEQEAHLLNVAELKFKELDNGKSKTT